MKYRLNIIALGLGIAIFLLSIAITYKAYKVSINIAEQNIYQFISDKASFVHAVIETNQHKTKEEVLHLVLETYSLHADYPDDEYVCIVDSNSVLILHTKFPETIGNNAGQNHLLEDGKFICTLGDLVKSKETFTGNYISSNGESQIAAFNRVHIFDWTIGVHRSKEQIHTEIRTQYFWFIVALVAIGGVIFPLSLIFMLYTIRTRHNKWISIERKAKEKLEQRDAKHSAMIANILDVIGIIGSDGLIKYKSPNITKAFGWLPEDFIGQSAFMAIHPDDLGRMQEAFNKIVSNDNFQSTIECKYRCKDGSYKNIKLTAINLINDKAIGGILINYHDVTQRVNAETALKENENKYRMLFENMQDIVCILDEKGDIVDVNKAGVDIYGYSRKELLNMNVSDLIYEEDKNKSDIFFNKLEEQGHYNMYEGRVIKKSGEIIWIQVSSSKYVKDGVVAGSQDIIRDITERKNTEEEISNQNKQLKELIATKDKFFSVIAHDLKNPISSNISLISMLNKNIENYDVGKQKLFVKLIDEGLNKTFKLLENLLMWSRSQMGVIKPKFDNVNLYGLVNDTTEPLVQSATNKDILLVNNISDGYVVSADKYLLSIIIRNLISNAIKFTPKKGSVTLYADKILKDNKEYIQVSVKDTGVGIPNEIKEKLFSVTDSISTDGTDSESGTGLGLILCKEFVNKLGGEIWVESEEGQGSVFMFTIPEGK